MTVVSLLLRRLVAAAAVWYIAVLAVLVCLRIRYPFELEWLEGAAVDHVRTILGGRPLYRQPSLDFTPLTYTPGYFYLAAGLSKLVGVGFLPLRLISAASTAGLLTITFRLAWREAGDPHAGLLATGLFAAMFGWTSGWLDLARTDSLFLLLAMSSVYILRWHDSTAAIVAAAVLMSASFLTKQTGLVVAVPVSFCCLLKGWRAFFTFVFVVSVIVIGTTIVFNRLTDGWYLYYVFAVPKQHPIQREFIYGFWRHDITEPFPIALLTGVLYLAWTLVRADRRRASFYMFVAAGFFAGAWVSRLHSLSHINVLLPAYLITAVMFAIAIHAIIRHFATSATSRRRRWLVPAVQAVCLGQLVRLLYSPAELVPSAQDVMAGHGFLQRIANTSGNVYVPYHGYLPALAGKDTRAHAVVLADVIRGGQTTIEKQLMAELTEALRTHQFDVVIMVESRTAVRAWIPIEQYYRPEERVVNRHSRFWGPETRYVPR